MSKSPRKQEAAAADQALGASSSEVEHDIKMPKELKEGIKDMNKGQETVKWPRNFAKEATRTSSNPKRYN